MVQNTFFFSPHFSGLFGQMASLKCIRLQHRKQNSLSVTTVEVWPFSSFLDVEAFVLLDVSALSINGQFATDVLGQHSGPHVQRSTCSSY